MCFASAVLGVGFGLCCLGTPSSGDPQITVDYLFSLDASQASVTYRARPTPAIAVNDQGQIAFPLRAGQIAILSADGRVVTTINDVVDGFPLQMSFGETGDLIALDQSASQLENLTNGDVIPYSTVTWMSLVAPAVLADLQRCDLAIESDASVAWDVDFVYLYETPLLQAVSRKTCKQETVVKEPLGYLIGAVNPQTFLFLNATNDCFLVSIRSSSEADRRPIDEVAGPRPTVLQLGPPPQGNTAETNKANRRRGWFWSAADGKLYKVMHAPAGFHFFEYSLRMRGQGE